MKNWVSNKMFFLVISAIMFACLIIVVIEKLKGKFNL